MKWKALLIGVSLFGFSSLASAVDGCKVLLCLANPNGPKAAAACVPTINELFDDLAHFKPFPTCSMASGPNGKSYAKQNMSYYDPCPTGTTALAQGAYAVLGSQGQPALYTGIGSGDGMEPGTGDNYSPLPGKVCVGSKTGSTTVQTGSGDNYATVEADIYTSVVVQDPQGSPRIIDVFIDEQLFRRVRW